MPWQFIQLTWRILKWGCWHTTRRWLVIGLQTTSMRSRFTSAVSSNLATANSEGSRFADASSILLNIRYRIIQNIVTVQFCHAASKKSISTPKLTFRQINDTVPQSNTLQMCHLVERMTQTIAWPCWKVPANQPLRLLLWPSYFQKTNFLLQM